MAFDFSHTIDIWLKIVPQQEFKRLTLSQNRKLKPGNFGYVRILKVRNIIESENCS